MVQATPPVSPGQSSLAPPQVLFRPTTPPPPPEYVDCGEAQARNCEADGCCGTVAAAPFRFGWSVVKLVGNGLGAVVSFGNFLGLSIGSLATGGCCSKLGTGIGLSAVDNLRTTSIALGNVASKVCLAVPTYFAKCCCRESIEKIRKDNYRYLERNCCSCCISKVENEYRTAINSCWYMQAVRCLSGEKEVHTNTRRFAHRSTGSMVNIHPADSGCCC